ncbi:MAG: hydantoinase/oxoprolinase family protein, partial [Candidatus Methylomirabilales bacterium]
VESLAICLLFSYATPEHEKRIHRLAQELNIPISAYHRIIPEYREYERTSTTVVNAYVSPLLDRYIGHLEAAIGGSLRIMQSNGGSISAKVAREEAVRTVLSGPAAGVVGGFHVAKAAGFSNVITFDMGGTSTDVSLCPGEIRTTAESSIAGCPIRVPMIDIHTVGSGGGSIAYLDEGGALRVGPESAGADPGPVCYGKGDRITVTDANLLLGRLDPDSFLGGRMKLDVERAEKAMGRFSRTVGLPPLEVAEGIVKVANATMEKAIRVISVERGFDPREFCLVSFGGAGGLHAFDLAKSLSIPQVLIPLNAGLLSAYGMLVADVVKDYSRSILIPSKEAPFEKLRELFRPLTERGLCEMREEGIPERRVRCFYFLDMRYIGQSYELTVPFTREYIARFHALHRQVYGSAKPEKDTEVVNLRLRVVGGTGKPVLPEVEEGSSDASSALLGERKVLYEGRWLQAKLYDRQILKAGNVILGPAVIVEPTATTFLPPDGLLRVDRFGNLLLSHV